MNIAMNQLLAYGQAQGWLHPDDVDYTANRLRHLLQVDSFTYDAPTHVWPLQAILDSLLDSAVAKGLVEDTTDQRDIFDTQLMDCITPLPSVVNQRFAAEGTAYFYDLSQATNYIRMARVAKDRKWQVPTDYGTVELTINLSKPEKDPRDIARAQQAPVSDYPACLLCKEHVGNTGSANQPPRNNHRIVPLTLAGEAWFLQYSPYVYYNEHCIVVNNAHTPMVMNSRTFTLLLEFVRQFPHYFVGSNAGLPIVGGSILAHEHYQGGRHVFTMDKAEVLKTVTIDAVSVGILKWPMTTLRLQGTDITQLVSVGTKILDSWHEHSDEAHHILARTNGACHNTVTPIARFNADTHCYELDLVLRNNRTNAAHPDGIFHVHEHLHHLKKENIGLIEVMGLAVLPGRLVDEIAQVEQAVITGETAHLGSHEAWARELIAANPIVDPDSVSDMIHQSIGHKFMDILSCCGVYKQTPAGLAGVEAFLATVPGRSLS